MISSSDSFQKFQLSINAYVLVSVILVVFVPVESKEMCISMCFAAILGVFRRFASYCFLREIVFVI